MKFKIFIFLVLNFSTGYSQNTLGNPTENSVKCYFDNSMSSLILYDAINGEKSKILNVSETGQKTQWFLITVGQIKNDWVQMKEISFFDLLGSIFKTDSINRELSKNKGKWLKLDNLKINTPDISVPDSLGIPFYSEPDLNSEIICKSGTFLILRLLDVHETWAKVSFTHNKINYMGWIEKENQCAFPWTSCPFHGSTEN